MGGSLNCSGTRQMIDACAYPERGVGVWTMFTESGTHYELDLGAMTVLRNPVAGGMRRDGEVLTLWAVSRVEVGLPATMVLDVRGNGLATIRTTSAVTALIPTHGIDEQTED